MYEVTEQIVHWVQNVTLELVFALHGVTHVTFSIAPFRNEQLNSYTLFLRLHIALLTFTDISDMVL